MLGLSNKITLFLTKYLILIMPDTATDFCSITISNVDTKWVKETIRTSRTVWYVQKMTSIYGNEPLKPGQDHTCVIPWIRIRVRIRYSNIPNHLLYCICRSALLAKHHKPLPPLPTSHVILGGCTCQHLTVGPTEDTNSSLTYGSCSPSIWPYRSTIKQFLTTHISASFIKQQILAAVVIATSAKEEVRRSSITIEKFV